DAMEKQMRADRDKRAVILTAEGERQSAILMAEGQKQSSILTAEGERQAAILRAQADRQAAILRAQGEGQAIQTVFQAIHDGNADQKLLAYQYLQMLPKIAAGDNSTMWIIPAELTKAMESIGGTIGKIPLDGGGNKTRVDMDEPVVDDALDSDESDTQAAVEAALEAAKAASTATGGPAMPKLPKLGSDPTPSGEPPAPAS
ncbi:MAG: SPFH domain-containing protein, partial [Aeromicrobium sp.]